MNKQKGLKFISLIMSIISLFSIGLLSSCIKQETTFIDLNESQLILNIGQTFRLTAQTDNSNAQIIWTSDATHIATVENGLVKAIAIGEATIKARSGNTRAFCEVVVQEEVIEPSLHEGYISDVYQEFFPIGAAVQSSKLLQDGYKDLIKNFNSITPENSMKWKNIEKIKGVYTFDQSSDSADKIVNWAKNNDVGVRGHCLLWYKSLPSWLHNEFDNIEYTTNTKQNALSYIEGHIETMMKHYGNNVYVWDVVNEALSNSIKVENLKTSYSQPYGTIWRTEDNMNDSDSDWVDWYKVCGGYDYIAKSFIKADEVRKQNNLNVELYYNDYSLNNIYKREACLNLIKMLKDNDAPIDGIGMQAHYKLNDYLLHKEKWLYDFEESIKKFIQAGLDVQITELDIRFDGEMTEQLELQQAEMYGQIFKIARKYAKGIEQKNGVTGITTWGVQDGCNSAWGTNIYPLLFNKDYLSKKACDEILTF